MTRLGARAVWSVLDSALIRNSFTLVGGTLATQAIVFLLSPLLARIFAIADFGNLANYNAWVAILALLSCLRYEHAIIVAADTRTTVRVVALTGLLCVASVVLYTALAFILRGTYGGTGYLRYLQDIALFIPLGVLGVCITSPLTQLNVKAGRFKRLAAVGVLQAVVTVALQLVFGFTHVRHGLILGTLIGYAFSSATLGLLALKDGFLAHLFRELTVRRMLVTARQFADFPRYTLGADAVNVVAQQFVPVFVLALFGPVTAGIYAFAIRIVRAPLLVISASISTALRREALDHLHEPLGLDRLMKHTTGTLMLFAAPPFLLASLYGPELFAVAFGAQWREAGRVVQILGPGIYFEFVALPLAVFFLVTRTQRYTFWIQIIGFALLVGALWMGRHLFGDFRSTCFLISGAMVIGNLLTIALARRVAQTSPPAVAPVTQVPAVRLGPLGDDAHV